MSKRWAWILLVALVVLGAGFRFYKLDEKSLWSDEVATIATSMGNSIDPDAYTMRGEHFDPATPVTAEVYKRKATESHGAGNLAQTANVLKANVHPPLFFWLMNLWIHAVGLTPEALRLPAAFFGTLAIPLMYWLALCMAEADPQRFSSIRVRQGFALLTAAMLALSAYQVDHAQDARQYALLLCLALGAVLLANRLTQEEGRRVWPWLALAVVLAMGLYSQYFFMLFAGFVLVYLAWQGRRNGSFLLKTGLTAALVGVLFLPWFSVFQEQMAFFKSVGHYTAGLWDPVRLPEKLWRIACGFFIPEHSMGKVLPLILLFVVLVAGFRQWRHPHKEERGHLSPILALAFCWLLVVVGGQIGLDVLKQTHTATIRRYLFLASPACYLLMAYAMVFLLRTWKTGKARLLPVLLSVAFLALMAWDTLMLLTVRHHSSDEFKQAAHWIADKSNVNDLVLVNKSGAMAVGMAYYLPPKTRMWGLDVPVYSALNDGSSLMVGLSAQLTAKPVERIWLVFSHAAPSTEHRMAAWLVARHFSEQSFRKFPGVKVALWQRQSASNGK